MNNNISVIMLSLWITSSAIILAVLNHCANGDQRIIKVAKLTNGKSNATCCIYGNCFCNSLDQALANLTSNVLINITTDVTLSSLIKFTGIENITIIGHNTPTVNCTNFKGGMHFTFCHNLIIQAITWDGCGYSHDEPGLKLNNSFNISVKNCSFHYSIGQAVLLSDVSGDVNISHCSFAYNSNYRGHGALIHYASNKVTNYHQPLSIFTINSCNFTYNKNAKSLVYISRIIWKNNGNITFCHTKFLNNQGTSVFIVNQTIYVIGKNVFQYNIIAFIDKGICIFSNSTVIFANNSDTKFAQNLGSYGVIFLRSHSNVKFHQNSMVTFISNEANDGGAIYSELSSNITFKNNSKVAFPNNSAKRYGGGILSKNGGFIIFEGSSFSIFDNNSAGDGGAIYSSKSYMVFNGASTTIFNNNTANKNGGAICSAYINIHFKANSSVEFSHNAAANEGGALYSSLGKVWFEEFAIIKFFFNAATNKGGAICLKNESHMYYRQFSDVAFSNNFAKYGGAVYTTDSDITFRDNSKITFTNNRFYVTVGTGKSKIFAIGSSIVLFNDFTLKWCYKTCLPHPIIKPYKLGIGSNSVVIGSDGKVWCRDKRKFTCESTNCYCEKLERILDNLQNMTIVNITDDATLSSVIKLEYVESISIIGHNITILCMHNEGTLLVRHCTNIAIKGLVWSRCGQSLDLFDSVIKISWSSGILIHECTFRNSFGKAISLLRVAYHVNISNCNFINNSYYKDHGAAIYYLTVYKNYTHILKIDNCNFSNNGNAKVLYVLSQIIKLSLFFTHIYLNNLNFQNNQGISVYQSNYYIVHVSGKILFANNTAENGAGMYIGNNSTVIFDSSNVKFISNFVHNCGAAIFLKKYSSVLFAQGSKVTFKDNKATNGTIYCKTGSNVTFKGTCNVTFSCNLASYYGSAIHSSGTCHVTFAGNTNVTFNANIVLYHKKMQKGGTIFSESSSNINFEQNSFIIFINNTAAYGAAIFSLHNSMITFKDQSTVIFNNNIAFECGVLTSSRVGYQVNMSLARIFDMQTLKRNGVVFSGHSFTTFINNKAARDGTVVFSGSIVSIKDHSVIIFKGNTVQHSSGGAFACYNNSNVTIGGFSELTFSSNTANQSGGGIHSYNMCNIAFKDNSTSIFIKNKARNRGGAIVSSQPSTITCKGNSTVFFNSNIANIGGALFLTNSVIIFKESAKILFYNNTARQKGGVGYFCLNSSQLIHGGAIVKFDSNMAKNAGALYLTSSNMWLE